MPAADLAQRKKNLADLCAAHSAHCPAGAARAGEAQQTAEKLPLSHATPQDTLLKILKSEALLSQAAVNPRAGSAEAVLGTADDVFLYLGAFSYPDTECGFLFLPALEENHQANGVSTPFDSGALVSKVNPPDEYAGTRVDFVRAHELPVSAYRELLGRVIADYAPDCDAYVREPRNLACHCGATRGNPFGLVGGDWRAVTFELRIPKRVPLSPPHLHAVFVPKGLVLPELHVLFDAGVRIERYDAGGAADSFDAMREACISFIQENFLK